MQVRAVLWSLMTSTCFVSLVTLQYCECSHCDFVSTCMNEKIFAWWPFSYWYLNVTLIEAKNLSHFVWRIKSQSCFWVWASPEVPTFYSWENGGRMVDFSSVLSIFFFYFFSTTFRIQRKKKACCETRKFQWA